MKKLSLFALLFCLSVLADPGKIYLANAIIDPEAPQINSLGAVCSLSSAGTRLYVVQPESNFTPSERESAKSLGIIFRGNIPPNAYLVEASEGALAALKQRFSILYAGEFLPEYKLLYPGANELSVSAVGEEELHPVQVGTFRKECLPDIVRALEALGAKDIKEVSGTLEPCVKTRLTNSQAYEIARRGDVAFVEPYAPAKPLNDVARSGKMTNVESLQMEGYTGKGQMVCIQDSGLDNGDLENIHPDFKNKTVIGRATTDIAEERGSYDNWRDCDEDGHGTHVCGSATGTGAASDGQYRGMAPDASLFMLCAGSYDGYLYTGTTDDLINTYNAGCRVMGNSWGANSDGYYSSSSRFYDNFIWEYKDYTILFAAGNENEDPRPPTDSRIGCPASAKNVITVGAAESYRPDQGSIASPDDGEHQGMAYFSSRGPCRDGRVKPDVAAPGTRIYSTLASLSKTSERSSYYQYMNGTSMATPITAGCCAVIRDYLIKARGVANPSAALVKAILVTGAKSLYPGQYTTFEEIPDVRPNNVEGHGHIKVKESLEPQDGEMIFNEFTFTESGQAVTNVYSKNAVCDLNVGLVWTDYPGTVGNYQQLVNDLDLYVVGPNGKTYTLDDHINNVEVLNIYEVPKGDYKVIVKAKNIMEGPQPCALVFLYSGNDHTTKMDEGGYKPFDWKGSFTVSISGTLGPKGLELLLMSGNAGIFNNACDAYVGLKFLPRMEKGKLSYKEGTFSFTYSPKNDKFSYQDKNPKKRISFFSLYNGIGYTYPDKCSIKGKGTIDGLESELTGNSHLTLLNNNGGRIYAVGDSFITMEEKGKTLSYSGKTSEGTTVKASVKKKTGKFNFKMKVVNSDGVSGAVSLDPGIEAMIPRDNN